MPSQKVLVEKQAEVEMITEKLKAAVSIVAVDYKGINVADDTALRSEMRENNVDYFVVKNSLLKFACEKSGFEEFIPILVGCTALAVSNEDALITSKITQKYSDKLQNVFNLKKGYVDGRFIEPPELKTIASLPPRDTLISMVAGSLNGIVAGLARAISEVSKKMQPAA